MADAQSISRSAGGSPKETVSSAGLWSWAFYDWANNAFATVIVTFVFAAYFTRHVAASEIEGSVFWGYTLSTAGMIVAIGAPILGAIADQGKRSKVWIAVFTVTCVLAMELLWFVRPSPSYLPLALLLIGIGIIGSEFAIVFYNAMLPRLAPPERIGRWSGWAWGLGYAGGLACLAVAYLAFIREQNPWFPLDRVSAEHVRASFLLAAAWYFLFAMPLFLITPEVGGPGKSPSRAIRDGFRQLGNSVREAARYGHIVRFLIARMIYIDGLTTLFAFGGVYAAGEYGMTEQSVLVFGIALNGVAGIGAAGFAWADDWLGSKRVIQLSLGGLMISGGFILLAGTLAVFWTSAMLLSVFVGPLQAASRSFLARTAPKSLQNEAFGLYALSGKATAFLGPFLVGWITSVTGSQRIGLGVVIVFFLVGFSLMLKVPEAKTG